ncbi:MAG: ABC transporter permease [Chitinophagaceae bacterium]|nr:ABC transporter permease [Chitinophagaceae bacterium]
MKVAGFIADRIAFSKGNEKGRSSFSRFIIRLSVVATVISVMVMILTLSFANGFQETISQKVFSFIGHIRIKEKEPDKAIISEETPILKNDSLVDQVRKDPDVESIYPYASKNAMLKTKTGIESVLVKGLDSSYDFNRFQRFMVEGRPIGFSRESYKREIMVSAYTASQMNIKLHDRILVYFIRPPDSTGERKMGTDKLEVVGIYKTGIEDYDRNFCITDIKLIRRLNYWQPDEIAGYEIFLKDYTKIDSVANRIYEADNFPMTWNTVSARDISPNIFSWLGLMDKNRNILISLMLVIAIINLITCLIILVLERIRMIGILKSLGATNWTVQQIFIRYAAIIAGRGIVIGATIGILISVIQQKTGFIKLKEEAYYVDTAAIKIVWWQVGAICGGSLLITMLVLMIPSFIIRKVQPVRAIQFR